RHRTRSRVRSPSGAPGWRRARQTSSATSAARSCNRFFGALLTAGYASAAGALISSSGKNVTASTQAELTKAFASAADTASRYPASVQKQIIAGAKTAFLHGDQWAYTAGIVAILLGAALVYTLFPKHQEEERLLAQYRTEDTDGAMRQLSPEAPSVGAAPARGGNSSFF